MEISDQNPPCVCEDPGTLIPRPPQGSELLKYKTVYDCPECKQPRAGFNIQTSSLTDMSDHPDVPPPLPPGESTKARTPVEIEADTNRDQILANLKRNWVDTTS